MKRGPSLVGSLGFLTCLDCSNRPSKKYFFPHRTLLNVICHHRYQVQYTYILKQKGVDGAWASFTV